MEQETSNAPVPKVAVDAINSYYCLMQRKIRHSAAITMVLILGWLSLDGWVYLQRGYSLSIALSGHASSVYHVDFPTWRVSAHVLLWVAGMIAILAYVTCQGWASAAAWLAFGATSLLGIHDVDQYGTIGSPTSVWSVLLFLSFALLVRVDPFAPNANA